MIVLRSAYEPLTSQTNDVRRRKNVTQLMAFKLNTQIHSLNHMMELFCASGCTVEK